MLTNVLGSLKHFLLTDTPTDQQTRSALHLIYMICFGVQAALSIVLALILAILSRTLVTTNTSPVTQDLIQTSNVSLIMLFAVMIFLLPSALLIASLWQRPNKDISDNPSKLIRDTKIASIASTIAVAVILAVSVWLCVFAYFISIPLQTLFLLVALSIVLYFIGFIATGVYVKTVNKVSKQD